MNNSKLVMEQATLTEDKGFDRTPILQEKRAELVKIIETINRVANSKDWKTLKKLLFDGLVEGLERTIRHEASKKDLDHSEIYRLQGSLILAKKYADFSKLADAYKIELENIKNQLHDKEEPGDGAPTGS